MSTQVVYAGVAAGCCAAGYVLMGVINNGIISVLATLVLLILVLWVISRKWGTKIDMSQISKTDTKRG